MEVSFIVVKFSELFNNKLVSSELYNKVKYLEVYIEELEYLRLENESIYLKLENKATYSRLHDKKDSKSIVEIESDVYDYKIEYSRLEKIKYSREY
ncbi:3001_t:CDS:1, partial [Gigaspora rosea]